MDLPFLILGTFSWTCTNTPVAHVLLTHELGILIFASLILDILCVTVHVFHMPKAQSLI